MEKKNKPGRPPKPDSKKTRFCIRLDERTESKLKEYCEKQGISRGEGIRQALEIMLNSDNGKLTECMDRTGMTKSGVITAGIELVYEKVKNKGV